MATELEVVMTEDTLTFSAVVDRYRQSLVFNNDLLKREYPDRYEFTTEMRVDKMRRLNYSSKNIADYEARRAKNYDKKFKIYCDRLNRMVEPAVSRYVTNIRAAFL